MTYSINRTVFDRVLKEQNQALHEESTCSMYIPGVETEFKNVIRVNETDLAKVEKLGWLLGYDEFHGEYLISTKMGHYLGVGSTGSGKTQSMILPHTVFYQKLPEHLRPSFLAIDPKGEVTKHRAASLREDGYNVIVIDTPHPEISARWNPLGKIYMDYHESLAIQRQLEEKNPDMSLVEQQKLKAKFARLKSCVENAVSDLVAIMIALKSTKDPCWAQGARQMATAVIYAMLYDSESPKLTGMTIERFTLANMARIGFSTQDDCEPLIEYLSRAADRFLCVKTALAGQIDIRAKQTRDSYVSTLATALGHYASYAMSLLTATSDEIDFAKIARGEKPTAIFLITDDRNPIKNTYVSMFVNQLVEALSDYADEIPDKCLSRDFVFLCDEFCNITPLPGLANKITTLRSRRIWLNMMVQSYAQLKNVYDENGTQIIRDNCDFQTFYGSNNAASKEDFVKLFGQKQGVYTSFSISNEGAVSSAHQTSNSPVLRLSDLDNLKLGEFYMYSRMCGNFKSYITPYFMQKHICHVETSSQEEVFNYYDPEEFKHDIQEVLRNEKEARENRGFDMLSRYQYDERRARKTNLFDDILRQLEEENTDQEDTNQEESEPEEYEEYREALTSEMLRILWTEGFETDRVESIHDDWRIAFPSAIINSIPTIFLRSEMIALSYQELQANLIGFEKMLVDMVIRNPLILDKDDAVSTLTHNQKFILKKYHMSKPFFDSYAKAIVNVRALSDEEFERRKKDVA